MNQNRLLVTVVIVAIALLAVLSARDADAIPAFARKYQLSCSTCHAPFPRLKPYGEEFAARGFRMEDASKEPSRATFDVGDPLLKLSRDLPLAVRFDGWASWKEDAAAEYDFEWPWSLKLLSGGPIADHVSYYFYGILEQGESIKLEDTFMQFTSVFNLPVDLTVGQFQVSDPIFKRELRLERNDYAIFKMKIADVPTNLTYDRGLVLSWHAPAEIEVVFEAVNGNGIEPAENDNFDSNGYKNTALRLMRQFGPVRVGAFGYLGRIGRIEEGEDRVNKTEYIGPDLIVDLGEKWQLSACWLRRTDSDPYFGLGPIDVVTEGGFGELNYFPRGQDGRWAVSLLYNRVTTDDIFADEVENASVTLNYLLARNLRLSGEVEHDLNAESSRVSVGFITAF